MKRRVFFSVLLSLVLMMGMAFAVSVEGKTIPDDADGSEAHPYVLNDMEDWEQFCDLLENNDNGFFTGKIVKLGADIGTTATPITRRAGNSTHSFTGTFNGDGHTLTVRYGSAESPFGTNYATPFAFADGSTIENLHVSGDIYSSGKFASGLVGAQYGAGVIRNCRVSTVIHSYTAGDGTHGGIVGIVDHDGSSLAITGCLFDGKLLTEGTTDTTKCGGFAGYRGKSTTLTITDSIYAPAATETGEKEISEDCATFARNAANNSITSCYFTRPLGTKQGTATRRIIKEAEGITVAVSGEPVSEYSVSGITVYEKGITCGGTIYDGDVYTINTAAGWNLFCDLLADNDKGYFTGKTVKLGADIGTTEDPVIRMAGGVYQDFTGTFDGDGHMLTVKYGSAESPFPDHKAAPFVNTEDCTIENLHVSGDIYSSAMYASGLVGSQHGIVAIRNCRVSTVIHSYTAGDGSHGGLVGLNGDSGRSSLTITGCLFDGKLLTEGTTDSTNCAGFVGERNKVVNITDSLYAPAVIETGEKEISEGSATFARNAADNSITNSYYTRALGLAQGMAARSITGAEGVTVAVSGEPVSEYSVSGITVYEKGITCGGTIYCGSGDNVSLNLGYGKVPKGYLYKGYDVDAGTLVGSKNPYMFTMPDSDVTVTAVFEAKPVQTAPAAPVVTATTADSITVKTVRGVEFSIDGEHWQTSGVFTGLKPDTTYVIQARKPETESHAASPTSSTVVNTTSAQSQTGGWRFGLRLLNIFNLFNSAKQTTTTWNPWSSIRTLWTPWWVRR